MADDDFEIVTPKRTPATQPVEDDFEIAVGSVGEGFKRATDSALGAAATIPRALKSGATMALDVLDTPGRMVREAVTARMKGRESNLTDAALMNNKAGDAEEYLETVRGDSRISALTKGAEDAAANQAGSLASTLTGGTSKLLDNTAIGSTAGRVVRDSSLLMAADPTTFLQFSGTGSRSAMKQLRRLAPEVSENVVTLVGRMLEKGDVTGAKVALQSGGVDMAKVAAAFGDNLESLGSARARIGVPFMQEKLGFEVGELVNAPARAMGKTLPEGWISRANEAATRGVHRAFNTGFDLPLHARENAQAARAQMVHSTRDAIPEAAQAADLSEHIPQLVKQGKQAEAIGAYKEWIAREIPDAPPELVEKAGEAFQRIGSDNKWIQGYQSLLNWFKQNRLYSRPVFAAVNAVDDLGKAVAGGMKYPNSFADAVKASKSPPNMPIIQTPSGTSISAGTLQKLFKENSFIDTGVNLKHEIDNAVAPVSKLGKVANTAGNVLSTVSAFGLNKAVKPADQARDVLMRKALFVDYLKQGMSPAQASNRVRDVLFDSAVGHTVKGAQDFMDVGRQLLPFWNYTAKSARILPELIASNPAVATVPHNIMRGIQAQQPADQVPRKFDRDSGIYATKQLEGEDDKFLTFEGRGVGLVEGLNPITSLTEPDSLGYNPLIDLAVKEPKWGDRSDDFLHQTLPSMFLGQPAIDAVNVGARHAFDTQGNVLGFPSDYRDEEKRDLQEKLILPNLFLPIQTRVSDKGDRGTDEYFENTKQQKVEKKKMKTRNRLGKLASDDQKK